MERTKPLSPVAQKRSFASRLFGYDVFLSFALGPPPRGTHSYASDLARRLAQRDFTVFFSEDEMPPGEQLDGALRKALLSSRALVVISNRGTLQDPRWVRKEVEEFSRSRPGRPVIPVNIGGALQDPSLADAAQTWLDFVGRVWVDDTEEAVAQGIASAEVVDRLAVAPRSARANTKWRWIVRGSVAALCTLALGLAISTKVALDNARRAQAELRDAVASRLVIQGQQMLNGSRGGGDLRGILQVLAASRMSATQESAGGLLDALLATRNVRKLLAIDVPVESLSISPDGQRIASGHNDHTVRFWDAATGQPLGSPLKGHSKPVMIVAYSPDGRLLASGSQDGTFQLWDTKTREARGAPLKAHDSSLNGLAFSPDGRRIVSSGNWSELSMWDSATGRALSQPTKPYSDGMGALAFSRDGRRMVSAGDGILFWDADTMKAIGAPIKGHVSAVAFSPDGRSIVTGRGDNLQLWDFGSSTPRGAPLEGHTASVQSVAFSPDGRWIASGSFDRTVRLWDAVSGRPLGGPLEGHRARVSSVAFTSDGSVVSGSTESATDSPDSDPARIRIWIPMSDGSLSQVLKTFPDVVRTGTRDNVQGLPEKLRQLLDRTFTEQLITFSPDGRRIATKGDDKTLRLWDAATGEPLGEPMEGHLAAITSVAFSPDGRRVASGSRDHTIRIWDVETGRPVSRLVGEDDTEVVSVAFSPDGQRLASVSAPTIKRNVRDDKIFRERKQLQLWDAVTGSLVSSQTDVNSVAFSPDNRQIVSGGEYGTLRLWDARSGESLSEPLEGHKEFVMSVAFSPDGRRIASGGWDKTIRLWDSQTGKAIGAPLQGHRGSVETIAFSPDGRLIVSGSSDGTIRLWDAVSGHPLGGPLEGHTGPLTAVAFSPDGLSIVSASVDKTVRRWPAPKAWASLLCGKVTRNLSEKEWREWVSAEIPYECQCSGLPIPANDGGIAPSRVCNVK